MKKVKGVLDELIKQNYHIYNAPGVYKELNALLLKWSKLEPEEKHKQYYKNLCHELNIFIKNKDPEYF